VAMILPGAARRGHRTRILRRMSRTVDRGEMLRKLGYASPEAVEIAIRVLTAAGLTNPRKSGISLDKQARVEAALENSVVRVCPRCGTAPPGEARRPVAVEDSVNCDVCRGSSNRMSVEKAAAACREAGLSRIVIVGGSPAVHKELRAMWPGDLEFRIVSGTERHTAAQARGNLEWAHAVVIWGSTALDHKVSDLYTKLRSPKAFSIRRRGIQALADELAVHARSRPR